MKHFLNTQDWSRPELDALLEQAAKFKRAPRSSALQGKSIALVFFNPSLRTRTSFELGAFHLGAHAVVLQPGKDAWPIEFHPGAIMDGDAEEHVAEAARVLSRYVDMIGVRAFPKFQDWQVDRQDTVLRAFATHATVPVINMETITHPCQELAHAMALQQHFGAIAPETDPSQLLRGRKYVLTWTYHPKPLNTAVANSALTIATRMGMDVTLLCPGEDYLLDPRYMECGPFSYTDVVAIEGDLAEGGFHEVEAETVELTTRVTAREAALGIVLGSPFRAEIERLDPDALERATTVVTEALRPWDGQDVAISAHVVVA